MMAAAAAGICSGLFGELLDALFVKAAFNPAPQSASAVMELLVICTPSLQDITQPLVPLGCV
jgi:hypothetical protein